MLILARHTARSELKQSRIPGLAKSRTARMACGHGIAVSGMAVRGVVLSHFTRWMHVPGMHDEHRCHGYLRPGHHRQKQHRRNGLLHHVVLVWQIKSSHDVTTITSEFVPGNPQGLPHKILKSRSQFAETERIPAGRKLSREHSLAGQHQFLSHLTEGQLRRERR